MFRSCRMMAATAVALLAIALAAGTADARSGHSPRPGGGNAVPVPATAVLDWNATAVATVRGAMPAKFQLESDLYMAYVQASVYDAVVSIGGRYEPYHDVREPSRRYGARRFRRRSRRRHTPRSRTTSRRRLATLLTTYTAYLAGLPGDGQAAGVAIGQAAANDIIAAAHGRRPGRRHLDAVRRRSAHRRRVDLRAAAVAAVGPDAVARVHATLHAAVAVAVPRRATAQPHQPSLHARPQRDPGLRLGDEHRAHSRADRGRAVLERQRHEPDQHDDCGRRHRAHGWTPSTPLARSPSRTWSTPTPASHAGTPSTTTPSGDP